LALADFILVADGTNDLVVITPVETVVIVVRQVALVQIATFALRGHMVAEEVSLFLTSPVRELIVAEDEGVWLSPSVVPSDVLLGLGEQSESVAELLHGDVVLVVFGNVTHEERAVFLH